MKKISLRDFQLKPSKYLEDLPIALSRYGKVIAVVSAPSKDIEAEAEEEAESKPSPTCKHGYPAQMCTKCKKRG